MRRLPLVVVLAAVTGCASNLSSLQTAVPIEPGHVRLQTGAGVYVPLGSAAHAWDAGRSAMDRLRFIHQAGSPYQATLEEQEALLTAGLSLAVFPPSGGYEVGVRTGVVKDVDVGFRYAVNSVRLDAKWRFFHLGDPAEVNEFSRRSVDVAVGLGVTRYVLQSPVLELLELVQVDDFSRWDLEVPLYFSQETGGIFKLYASPKYIFSHTTLDERLVEFSGGASSVTGLDLQLPMVVRSHFVGVTGGFAIGFKYAHLYLELTAGNTFCNVDVLGSNRALGGLTIYPAAGLGLEF